jgi:hypothetical protein
MNIWLRRAHLVLTLGGGFMGVVITTAAFKNVGASVNAIFLLLAIAFYAFAIAIGLRISEGHPSRSALLWFYGLQIPQISSSLFAYGLSSGLHMSLGILEHTFYWNVQLGCNYEFLLLKPAPLGLGMNIFAALMFVLSFRMPSNHRRSGFGE